MRLFLIRHGESTNNFLSDHYAADEYIVKRTPDPELTELGWRQAKALAKHLATATVVQAPRATVPGASAYGITHLYCSAMVRAMQTAQPIAEALGIAPRVWVDLHERGGVFYGNPRQPESVVGHHGMTRSDMQERFPGYHLPSEVTPTGWWHHGHESGEAFYARTLRVAEQLRQLSLRHHEENRHDRIALVMHGALIDLLLKALLNQLPGNTLRYTTDYTAINCLDLPPSGLIFLRYINRTEHLTSAVFKSESVAAAHAT